MSAAAQPDLPEVIARYHAWLRDRTMLKQIGRWTEITTPFLDRHNDCIQLYARKEDRMFVLTDDGATINDLEMSGCNLSSPKRQELLITTLNGFGVRLVDRALETHASADNFPVRKHNLIQAILAVNDLFYLAAPTVKSLFLEDVAAWLDTSGIRYVDRVKISGHSGFDHVFDFTIPRSVGRPERFLKGITNPNRESAQSYAFAWIDIKETRAKQASALALLNDNDRAVSTTVTEAFSAYGITPVLWSRRDQVREELAA